MWDSTKDGEKEEGRKEGMKEGWGRWRERGKERGWERERGREVGGREGACHVIALFPGHMKRPDIHCLCMSDYSHREALVVECGQNRSMHMHTPLKWLQSFSVEFNI